MQIGDPVPVIQAARPLCSGQTHPMTTCGSVQQPLNGAAESNGIAGLHVVAGDTGNDGVEHPADGGDYGGHFLIYGRGDDDSTWGRMVLAAPIQPIERKPK